MVNIDLVKRMIKEVASNGENICKFQTQKVENLKSSRCDKDRRRKIYNKAKL